VVFPAAVSEEGSKAGRDGSGVDCVRVVGVEAETVVAETTGAGAEATGAETLGAETVGVAVGVFATGEEGCFRAKYNVAATTMIAAAVETRISVVEFDLVGCFAWDADDATLAAVAVGSAAAKA
jgi:hypothetical protein